MNLLWLHPSRTVAKSSDNLLGLGSSRTSNRFFWKSFRSIPCCSLESLASSCFRSDVHSSQAHQELKLSNSLLRLPFCSKYTNFLGISWNPYCISRKICYRLSYTANIRMRFGFAKLQEFCRFTLIIKKSPALHSEGDWELHLQVDDSLHSKYTVFFWILLSKSRILLSKSRICPLFFLLSKSRFLLSKSRFLSKRSVLFDSERYLISRKDFYLYV